MTNYTRETHAERLLELSDEVRRIAGSLVERTMGRAPIPHEEAVAQTFANEIPEHVVKWLIRTRRERAQHFPQELFADPAWDIMLDLFHAELTGCRATVGSVSAAAHVPPTTALRWLKTLEEQNFIIRTTDPHDRRRIFIELSSEARSGLQRWFAESFGTRSK